MHRQLIIFARQGSESWKKLQSIIGKNTRAEDVDWCNSLESFLRKFRTYNCYSMVLLLIETHSDLEEFLNVSDFFNGLRVFLILPDREEDTISMGYRLFPRFVTYNDSDFMELSAIFRNILEYNGAVELS
jgi:hypothetical protein